MYYRLAFVFALILASISALAQYSLAWSSALPDMWDSRETFRLGPDGSAFVAFDYDKPGGTEPKRVYVLRYSNTGQLLYSVFLEGLLPAGNKWRSIQLAPAPDGKVYLLATYLSDTSPYTNVHLVYAFDQSGNVLWSRTCPNGMKRNYRSATFFHRMPDDRLVVADWDVYWLDTLTGELLDHTVIDYWDPLLLPSRTEAALYVTGFQGSTRFLKKLTPGGLAWQVLPFIPQPGFAFHALDMQLGPDEAIYMLGMEGFEIGSYTHILNRIQPNNGSLTPIKRWSFPYNAWDTSGGLSTSCLRVYSDGHFFVSGYDQVHMTSTFQELSPEGNVLNQVSIYDPNDPNHPEVDAPVGVVRRFDIAGRALVDYHGFFFDNSIRADWFVDRDLTFGRVLQGGGMVDADEAGYLLARSEDQLIAYSPAGTPRDDWYSVPEGQTLVVSGGGVRNNDLGAIHISAESLSLPTLGTLTFQSSGAFTYKSTGGFGNDIFLYRLRNGAYASRKANVLISVKPILPLQLTSNKLELYGGQSATLTVRLERAAALNGAVVKVASTLFEVPATVTVPGGAQQVSFIATAKPLTVDRAGAVNAIRATKMVSKSMTIKASELASLAVNKSTLRGGGSFLLYTGLVGTAASPGMKVNLTSDKPVVPVPASVTVPTGLSVKSISVTTKTTATTQVATISGQHGSVTKTVTVTVTP